MAYQTLRQSFRDGQQPARPCPCQALRRHHRERVRMRSAKEVWTQVPGPASWPRSMRVRWSLDRLIVKAHDASYILQAWSGARRAYPVTWDACCA